MSGNHDLGYKQLFAHPLLIDQRSIDPQALEGSRNLVAALFRLELSDSASVLIDIVATLRLWLDSEEQLPLRRSIFQWLSHLEKRELEGVSVFDIESVLLGEGIVAAERIQRKYATWAEAERDVGRQQGLAQGREEALHVLRSTLKGLLSKRFGNIPVAALARVEQADEAELERWIYAAVDAESIETVIQP